MNDRIRVLNNHVTNDLGNLIESESDQNALLLDSIKILENEIKQETNNRISSFKKRAVLIIIVTIISAIYCLYLVSTLKLDYHSPHFYFIIFVGIGLLMTLKYHFSQKLNYTSDAFYRIQSVYAKRNESIKLLEDIKSDLDKISKEL